MIKIIRAYVLAFMALTLCLMPYTPNAIGYWAERGEVALRQSLLDLTSDMTIMCLAAHPDDEDGATLTYYRKKYGVKTAILYGTRGEGGQNEIGPELYEELGVIRAHEIQDAASIYGAEAYDLNKRDFGFSKNAEETLKFWGYEDSLRRMVKIIREVRPDVIITNHDTEHGHGHHRACGILILEAFNAAADADKFPEQINNGLESWQAKRLFLRSWEEGADVRINVGEYDPSRGYSYAQIANEGLKMHKSQGMGGEIKRGPVYRYYKLIKSSTPAPEKLNSLLDGLSVDSVASDHAKVPDFARNSMKSIDIQREPLMKSLMQHMRLNTDEAEPAERNEETELEIAASKTLDLYLTVKPDDNIVTQAQEFDVRVSLTNCGDQVIEDIKFDLIMPRLGNVIKRDNPVFERLGYNETATETFTVRVLDNASLTLPYVDRLYDDSFMKSLIKGMAIYEVHDMPMLITSAASDIDISDNVELHILPETTIIPFSSEEKTSRYVVNVINRIPDNLEGHVELFAPEGWKVIGIRQDVALKEDQQGFAAFDVTIPADTISGNFSLEAKVSYKGPDGAPATGIASGTVKAVDVKVADDLHVGYVKSYDNTIERTLKQLGVSSRSLESDDLRFGELSIYDTIILDIRAYLVRADLRESNQRLLDYVDDGGNLAVMYHKTFEWNDHEYAPYKLVLSRNRVTVEEAPIAILAPDHALLTFPNKINESDWEDWIQERGLYFPSEYASEYKELLSCHDPDEKPLKGGYLMAKYGEGTYIYTSYVWYRQLQILNPGAFRNFANMISLPKQ